MTPKKQGVASLPLYWMGGMLAALVIAPLAYRGLLPVPPCMLRKFTGIPCPFCGATRCLIALSDMRWEQAFLLNPLVFIIFVVVAGCGALWLLERISGGSWLASFITRARNRCRWPVLLALVLLNWFFVLWMKTV